MCSIRQPYDSGSRDTKCVDFSRCVEGREHQIHKIWCLSSNGVTREVHLTAQIDVSADTVGHFLTQYLYENGRRIPVIIQIFINGSVKILGITADAWGCGLPFIENVQGPTVTSGWVEENISNQNWGVTPGGPYSNINLG